MLNALKYRNILICECHKYLTLVSVYLHYYYLNICPYVGRYKNTYTVYQRIVRVDETQMEVLAWELAP